MAFGRNTEGQCNISAQCSMLDIVEDSDAFFVCALFYVDYLINSHLGHYDQCQFAPEDDTNLHESQAAASRSGTFAKSEIFVFFESGRKCTHCIVPDVAITSHCWIWLVQSQS